MKPLLFVGEKGYLWEKRVICGEKRIEVEQCGFGLWTWPSEASHCLVKLYPRVNARNTCTICCVLFFDFFKWALTSK